MSQKISSVKVILGEFDKGGFHLFINLKVNGVKCRFLIDTGASKSVLDKKYFEDKIGKKSLKTVKQETTGLHSSVSESHFGKIKEIELGQHLIKNYETAVIDLSHVNTVYKQAKKPKIIGILGSDLMLKYKMIVDYGQLKIYLP
jgi:predicted aspartyl protease